MVVKRKRDDDDAMSICSTSPPSRDSSASPLSRDSMMVDNDAITQHQVPLGVHSRTLKRWRNARPDEQSVHEYTISKLFSAQRSPAQQTPTPQIVIQPSGQAPQQAQQQRNILSFFPHNQTQTRIFSPMQTAVQTSATTIACSHCECVLETPFDDEEGERYACRGCSRKVCGGCSTGGEEWGMDRQCLECALR
ncbi:hypothetical protein DRE_06575 [Drechslerella stenobrocha 248]|uniref:Uncharacterized protein n=1 Tax=Drechslerella stenobrocha 248 TaxID=1043628 RepID=W7HNF2_9PEZI|nr:hypothetical protein DRE_06575 [Drechslerella stenobrocha 248]